MKHAVRIATVVAVLGAVGLQSLGWYGTRTVMFMYQLDVLGAEYLQVSASYAWVPATTLLGSALGVIACALAGPAPAAAGGLVLAALGLTLCAVAPGQTSFGLSWLLAALGVGIYRPAVFVAAIRAFGRGYEPSRIAVCVLAYALVNSGALTASLIGATLSPESAPAVFLGAAVAFGVGAALLLALFGLSFALPSEQGPGTAQALDARAIGIGFGTAALGATALAAWSVGVEVQSEQLFASGVDVPSYAWSLNPVVVVLCGTVVAGLLGIAQLVGARVPALVLAGVGLLAMGAGLGPAVAMPGSVAVFMLGSGIGAFGEVLTFGPLAARAGGEIHFRLAALPVAILGAGAIVGGMLAGPLIRPIVDAGGAPFVLGAAALACALLGVVAIAAGFAIDWLVEREPEVAVT